MGKKNYLIDMDGVLVSGKRLIPGADEFIKRLNESNTKYLVLTNNSIYAPIDLAHRLQVAGLDIHESKIFTSAMATAAFMHSQKPNGSAFVIGEAGLTLAIHSIGYIQTGENPDYVVLGETFDYNFHQITKAVRLIMAGASFLATSPAPTDPTEDGIVPACGAMAGLIEKASGRAPFFCGKPNPFMMRSALKYLGVHSEDTIMVGDRMDTDVISGIQSGMQTILVLSGVTSDKQVKEYPYRPHHVLKSVAEIIP